MEQRGLSVGRILEPCKNGRTTQGADWRVDSGVPNAPRITWGLDPPNGRGNFAVVQPIERHCKSTVALFAAKISDSIT